MDPTRLPQAPYGPRFGDGVRQEPSMERRTFRALVSGGLLAVPLTAEAQQAGKVYQIGFLGPGSAEGYTDLLQGLRARLRELGYVEGRLFLNTDSPRINGGHDDWRWRDVHTAGIWIRIRTAQPPTRSATNARLRTLTHS